MRTFCIIRLLNLVSIRAMNPPLLPVRFWGSMIDYAILDLQEWVYYDINEKTDVEYARFK
jgi:hypothetical protein